MLGGRKQLLVWCQYSFRESFLHHPQLFAHIHTHTHVQTHKCVGVSRMQCSFIINLDLRVVWVDVPSCSVNPEVTAPQIVQARQSIPPV